MTPISYSACLRQSSGMLPPKRLSIPFQHSLMNQDSMVSPSGTGKAGMKEAPSSTVAKWTSHCSATSRVLSQACGISRKSSRISRPGRR